MTLFTALKRAVLWTLLVLMLNVSMASSSFAGQADAYVKNLVGKWRGGGIVTREKNGKQVKLRCSTKNTLSLELRTLSMKGRCASALGSKPLVGSFKYSEDGSTFEHVTLKIAGRGGESLATLNDSSLVLDTDMSLNTEQLSISRNVISSNEDEYSIDLYSQQDGQYVIRGTLNFSRKPS